MNYTIKKELIAMFNDCQQYNFPKYTSQLINWANQNAQGTRPKTVGQLSELFPEFLASGEEITVENWYNWYTKRHGDAIDTATDKIFLQIQNLKEAIQLINKELVMHWVKDLVINKTFNGMYVQRAILSYLAEEKGVDYGFATPIEESQGIDGYIDNVPYSVKPDTYKIMERLPETIDVKMIYYSKSPAGLKIEVDE